MSLKKIDIAAKETVANLRTQKANPDLYKPIDTGIHELNMAIGGMPNKAYIAIGGKEGVGKTAVIMHLMTNLALAGRGKVLHFGLEEVEEETAIRALTRQSATVDRTMIRDLTLEEEHFQELERISKTLERVDLYTEDAIFTMEQIIRVAIEQQAYYVAIDYLQLAADRYGKNEAERLTAISRQIVQARNKYGIGFLVAFQLNEKGSAFGSRSVYKDANLVIQIEEVKDENKEIVPGVLDLVIKKSRISGKLRCTVNFSGAYSRITDVINISVQNMFDD